MALLHNQPPVSLTRPPDPVAGALGREMATWTPPTPRWTDAPARARVQGLPPLRAAGTNPSRWQRLRHRVDLLGWVLGGSADRLMIMAEDPSDPRVIIYNRIVNGSLRYTGPQAILLRLAMGRC